MILRQPRSNLHLKWPVLHHQCFYRHSNASQACREHFHVPKSSIHTALGLKLYFTIVNPWYFHKWRCRYTKLTSKWISVPREACLKCACVWMNTASIQSSKVWPSWDTLFLNPSSNPNLMTAFNFPGTEFKLLVKTSSFSSFGLIAPSSIFSQCSSILEVISTACEFSTNPINQFESN